MENKQTAVEWLVANLHFLIIQHKGWQFEMMVEKAKAMEKEQHGETWDMALKQMVERGYVWERAMTDFDDYYSETYKNDTRADN